jgi:endonuclease/exonuclease/phosphatase family metal-dependent hydrolase
MPELRAVTYNLGCGGPHGAVRVQAAEEWATSARAEGFDLVFVQELPSQSWLDGWKSTHHVIATNDKGYKVRSALLIIRALECKPFEFATSTYHDSYVAAATVVRHDGREVTCLSVHASPSRVSLEWRAMWETTRTALPLPRAGEVLWDSDLLLASMVALVPRRSLLIAGDWNEARDWDKTHAGRSGVEFFEQVEAGGLVDCTWARWKEEIATCAPEGRGEALQLDHVFATRDIADRVVEPTVQAVGSPTKGSDHSPISFSLVIAD